MKKKMTYLLAMLLVIVMSSTVSAQYVQVDFEPDGLGAAWTWIVVENDDNPPLEIVANPDASGINTSATVAQFTARQTGQPWALCYTDNIEEFEFDETNTTVTIMVYKPVLSNVAVKFEGSSPAIELLVASTVINQWEEITYDFSGSIGNTYSRLVVIPDFAPRDQDNTAYFDNMQIPEGNLMPPPEPTVAAPIPTENEADVISVFSDSYTDLTGTDFNPPWGQTTIVTEEIDGNSMLKYANFNYQGTEFDENQDLSSMGYMHIDMWTADATVVQVTPISASTGEHLVSLTPITSESWNSYDIPLSDFTDVSMSDIYQLKFDGQAGVTPSTIYLDNIYFYTATPVDIEDVPGSISSIYALDQNYPNPFKPTTTINFSMADPGHVSLNVYDTSGRLLKTLLDGDRSSNTYQLTWNGTDDNQTSVSSGVYFYKLTIDGKTIDTKRMILMK